MRNIGSQLEIIVLNKKDALQAQEFGADRLELLLDLDKGGLTPSIEIVKEVTSAVEIPVYVMLRNLWDSFVYDEKEFDKILQQLELIKQTKAKGIVFGSLNVNRTINEDQLKIIIAAKGKLELTFSRAIDATIDYQQAVETLDEYKKIDYILTSGHSGKAIDGIENLNLAAKILKRKLIIGSGVTPTNCYQFLQIHNIKKLHVGTSVRIKNDIFNELNSEAIKVIKNII